MSTSGHAAPLCSLTPPLLMHFKSCTRLDRRRLTRPRNGQLNGQSGCRRRRRPCRSCRHNKNVLGAGSRSSSEAGTACGKDKCTTNSCTSVAHFNKVNCILALCAAGGVTEEREKGVQWEMKRKLRAPSVLRRFLSSHLLLALFIIVRFAFDNVCDVLVIVLLSCLFTNCVANPLPLPLLLLLSLFMCS